ncbi:hypothetical protein CVV38_01305 [Candidatus Peregrinibacteria bacterium HGW-Peregrinibacteria-1]|jgi:hypothetical protein|nr:MAG: hypothetical protein CVV38_01305 [Candidatus Peregrinibacteria bacterium HGW-Peregrinibacteria-1]
MLNFNKILVSLPALALIATSSAWASLETYHSLYMGDQEKAEIYAGEYEGEQFGASLVKGDFNGDGVDDMAISAPFHSSEDKMWVGAVYVFIGGENAVKAPVKVFLGNTSRQQFGLELAGGDFDNDGKDDLAISSYKIKEDGSATRRGMVHILYGNSMFDNAARVEEVSDAVVLHNSVDYEDGFGLELTVEDFNNDSIDDLVVGAPLLAEGRVFGYVGSNRGVKNDFSFVLKGKNEKSRFGNAIKFEDINGDGAKELIVGAYMDGINEEGSLYVYTFNPRAVGQTTEILKIYGDIEYGWLGWDIDVGDINGDGFGDIVASYFPYKNPDFDGKVGVILGHQFIIDKQTAINAKILTKIEINGPLNGRMMAYDVKVADLNNDGHKDIILGAPGVSANLKATSGNVYVLYGGPSDEAWTKSHYTVKYYEVDEILYGDDAGDWFGSALEVLDFNNDGYNDLAVGARYNDGPDSIDNGRFYLLNGDEGFIGEYKEFDSSLDYIERGAFVSEVVQDLGLKEKKKEYLDQCMGYLEFCLYNFVTVSRFDEMELGDTLRLYPDVNMGDPYYDDINLATLLGVVNGFLYQNNTPFLPQERISRIQALKVVLEAADLVYPKYEVEYRDQVRKSIFKDISEDIDETSWYFRYVNFAVEAEIINQDDYFRPDEPITSRETEALLEKTIKYLNTLPQEEDETETEL